MNLALITGATSGIGKEIALQLAAKGVSLILTGRSEASLNELRRQITSPLTIVEADLGKENERARVMSLIAEMAPDCVINNAGFGLYGEADQLSLQEQMQMCAVNCEAPLEITLAAISALKKRGKKGVILNVSSIASEMPTPLMSVYGATKAFLTSVSKSLDYEVRKSGIRVLVALPGQVKTDFSTRASKRKTQENSFAMSASFAAKEILWQIEKRKQIHRFDIRYRWISKFPESMLAKSVMKNLQKRL